MLTISVTTPRQMRHFEHASGPLEIGRGPQIVHPRLSLDDPYLSRDHLRIEEAAPGRLRLENISRTNAVVLGDGSLIEVGTVCQVELPIIVRIGELVIEIEAKGAGGGKAAGERELSRTVLDPWPSARRDEEMPKLSDLGETPSAERLANWFERLLAVQRAAAGSAEFYGEAARAVVDLIGLDRGCVLLDRQGDWDVAAQYATRPGLDRRYSRGVIREVVEQKRTLYRAVKDADIRSSLLGIEAVVASPIFSRTGDVIGIVYGTRSQDLEASGVAISPLEAQVVQLLAAAVGAGLARQEREAETARMRVQFEQFFSPELIRELQRDPSLLEGRDRELTVAFADLRGFSGISEQLGPRETFRLMRDVMDRLTATIVENGGAIIDYYGDGVAVMWNAPADQPDHALRACRTALAMRRELPGLNADWRQRVGMPLELGIGINTGPAQVGNSGSSRRLKYGPRGHTVNLASRIEGATRQLGVSILIAASTQQRLPTDFALRRLCRARLSGVHEPVTLFELPEQPPPADWLSYRDLFETALAWFETRDWSQAEQSLALLANTDWGSRDPAIERLLVCTRRYSGGTAEAGEPVLELTSK